MGNPSYYLMTGKRLVVTPRLVALRALTYLDSLKPNQGKKFALLEGIYWDCKMFGVSGQGSLATSRYKEKAPI